MVWFDPILSSIESIATSGQTSNWDNGSRWWGEGVHGVAGGLGNAGVAYFTREVARVGSGMVALLVSP